MTKNQSAIQQSVSSSDESPSAMDTAPGEEQIAVVHMDPRALLIDSNVRLDSRADRDLIASIRDLGVLQPIVAVATDEGTRVRFGHRRTQAAVEGGLSTVPVLVVGVEDASDSGQVERLLQQFAENEQRVGLTEADRVEVVAQLAAFGVSAAQIARRTRMGSPRVDAALAAAGSELARAATARYDLTLDQAAVVAEFDGETETVSALVAAAKTGGFEHVAQRAWDDREQRAQLAAEAERLTQAGVRVIDEDDLGAGRELTFLTDDEETAEPLDPQVHTACPGHAAYLDRRYSWNWDDAPDDGDRADGDGETTVPAEPVSGWRWLPVWVCPDPAAHGHHVIARGGAVVTPLRVTDMDDEQRETARAARREVIECNKNWTSAETVRQEWLKAFVTRKSAPKATATFLATALVQDSELLNRYGGRELAMDLLGRSERGLEARSALLTLVEGAGDARAQVLHLALVLAAYEAATSREDWRTLSPSTRRYLGHLRDLGYTLSEVEVRALHE